MWMHELMAPKITEIHWDISSGMFPNFNLFVWIKSAFFFAKFVRMSDAGLSVTRDCRSILIRLVYPRAKFM
jgi:hypothetical protein